MSVAREARVERDVGERAVGVCELRAGVLDAESADVSADGNAVVPPKFAAEVDGVNPGFSGETANGERVAKTVVEQVADCAKPRSRR